MLTDTQYACLPHRGCWHAACVLLVDDETLRAELLEQLASNAAVHAVDGRWQIIGPVAYRIKHGCTDPRCTRRPGDASCFGWHCVYCDEACSSFGHECEVGQTILAAAEELAKR